MFIYESYEQLNWMYAIPNCVVLVMWSQRDNSKFGLICNVLELLEICELFIFISRIRVFNLKSEI